MSKTKISEEAIQKLIKLAHESDNLNYTWKRALRNLSLLLVGYSIFFMYKKQAFQSVIIFHFFSAIFYLLTAYWLNLTWSILLLFPYSTKSFYFTLIIMLSQVSYFLNEFYKSNFSMKRDTLEEYDRFLSCFPVTMIYFMLVAFALKFMRSNSDSFNEKIKDISSSKKNQ